MNERLKELRTTLGITLEEFGKRVGVTRSAVGRIEKGERKVTEQMALSICREFHVNYHWLVNGDGEMFAGTPENVIEEVVEEYNLDEDDEKMLRAYLNLSTEQRKVIKEYFKNMFV